MGLNLFRVLFADGGDLVAVDDARLQQIQLAEEFKSTQAEQIRAQIELVIFMPWENPLMRQVVDGQHTFHRGIKVIVRVRFLEINRNQRRVPIVTMNDIGFEIKAFQQSDDFQTIILKTFQVVRVIAGRIAIDTLPSKKAVIFNQINLDIFTDLSSINPLFHTLNGKFRAVDIFVKRQKDCDLDPDFFQKKRQCPAHIAQPAGLNEWKCLRGTKCDLHLTLPSYPASPRRS